MDYKKRVLYSVVFAAVIVFIGAMVSAGWRDLFLSPEGSKNVAVSFTGTDPVQVIIYNNTLDSVIPNIGNSIDLNFKVELIDPNGAADINETSTNASFTNGGVSRANSSCVFNGESSPLSKNFSCTITMWYFDKNDWWTISAGGRDIGNKTFIENTSIFYYGLRRSFTVDSGDVQFNTLTPGASNEEALNNPTYINNTGNYIVPSVGVNGTDLPGQISGFFGVGNFSARVNQGALCNTGNQLVKDDIVNVASSGFNPGNLSAGGGVGQQTLNFCIPLVPTSLLTQQYSTTNPGGRAWEIDIP